MSESTISGYSDLTELGRGGFAVVYRATQIAFNRPVALKVLHRIGVDADTVRRFQRECLSVGALSWHPHIVSVFDAGTADDGTPYLAMEYLPGGSLADQIKQSGSIPWARALVIGVQVADALEAAHRSDVLHRDVKPENLLLDRFDDCQLADFGIAAIPSLTMTAAGIMTGTLAHAAPEVLTGARASIASDVYSLGSTLYALIVGVPAFTAATHESLIPMLVRVATEQVPDLRRLGVPDSVALAIERAMSKTPEARYSSAGEMARALQLTQRLTGQQVTPTKAAATNGPTSDELVTGVADTQFDPPLSRPLVSNPETGRLPSFPTSVVVPREPRTETGQDPSAWSPATTSVHPTSSTPGEPPTPPWVLPTPPPPSSATADRGDGELGATTTFVKPETSRAHRTRGRLIATLTVVVAAVTAVALIVLLTVGGDEGSQPRFPALGDGGPAVEAQIDFPTGVAIGSEGDIYIADSEHHLIRRVSPDGAIDTIAGTGEPGYSGDKGPAIEAVLAAPVSVAVDASGNIYFVDRDNHRIRRVSANGVIETIAGTGTRGFSGDGGQANEAQLGLPVGIALDTEGALFIADTDNQRIRRVGSDGVITTVAGKGTPGAAGDGGPALEAQLQYPVDVAVDLNGAIYIADTGNNRIRRVGPEGIIETIAGMGTPGFAGDKGPAVEAQLEFPTGVDVFLDGSFVFVDQVNVRIRRVGPDGIIETIAGTGTPGFAGDKGPASEAQLDGPFDVVVGPNDSVLFTDRVNNRVRRIADGTIHTVAGSGES